MNPTIYDIARRANLSHAAVSMALRGVGKLKNETRERIVRLAGEMGYIPNHAAVSLKNRRTKRIAFAAPAVEEMFPLLHSLADACYRDGYEVVLMNISKAEERQRDMFDHIVRGGYDAAVTFLYRYEPVAGRIQWLLSKRRPLAIIGPPTDFIPAPGLFSIPLDSTGVLRQMVRLLLDKGHRRIGYTVGEGALSGPQRIYSDIIGGELRLAGVDGWSHEVVCSGDVGLEDGYRTGLGLPEKKPGLTALQCFNDLFAIGCIRGLRERGLRVPEDVSIVGWVHLEVGRYQPTRLSTIDLRYGDVGRVAWSLLSRQLSDPDWERIPEPVRLEALPVIGESIGVAPDARRLTDC